MWFATVPGAEGARPAAIGRCVVDGRWAGFAAVEVDPVRMAYYRHARVVDDLAEFAEGVLDGGADEASRLDDLGWLRRLLAPGGAVALALADPAG